MFGKYKFNAQAKLTLAVVLLIIIAAAGYVLFAHTNKTDNHNFSSELVYADSNKGQLYIADKDGKVLSKTTYSKFAYLTYQAVSSNGGLLISQSTGTDKESFIYTRNNAAKTYEAANAAQLHSAVLLQSSHQVFFEDDKNLLLVSCPDANTTCALNRLDLSNGSIAKVIDTGIKQTNINFPTVYLVGYSSADHTAYIRVVGAKNKLGGKTAAIYKIDTYSNKVTGTLDFPLTAGTALTLSPDGKKIAYISTDIKNKSTINILDLKKNQTQKVQWNNGTLPTLPTALKWSPDSKKLLLQTVNIAIGSGNQTPKPLILAYIDTSNGSSVNVLQEIKDPAHQTIASFGWLDNSTVVFQLKKSSAKAYDFSNASSQTLKQDIGSKSSSPLQVPAGDLLQAINY